MDEGTKKTQKNPKCRLYWCLIEFIDWRYTVSHVGIFDPSCELLPLYLLSDLHHPFPPSQSKRTVYTESVWLGGGVLSCVVDHILFLTRFRTYKIATPPQTKMTSKDDWYL
jgi:hypothetical protein